MPLRVKALSLTFRITLYRSFADLLAAGMPVLSALRALHVGQRSEVARMLSETANDVAAGFSLGDACARHEALFDERVVSAIRAVEGTGRLPEVLRAVAASHEEYHTYIQEVRKAVRVPMFTLLTAILVITCSLAFVVPTFTSLFSLTQDKLPAQTQRLLAISRWLQEHGFTVVWTLLIAVLAGAATTTYWLPARRWKEWVTYWIPCFGHLWVCADACGVLTTLSVLLTANVALCDALPLASKVVKKLMWEEAGRNMRAHLMEGGDVASMIMCIDTTLLPEQARNLLLLGEKGSELRVVCMHAARLLNEKKLYRMQLLTSFLPVVLSCVIGSVVLLIIHALYLPLFSMLEGLSL